MHAADRLTGGEENVSRLLLELLASDVDISGHCLVCRPCCNDITRLKKDPSYRPRWEKCRVTECTIPNTERIQSYLAEKTGYEGVLKDGDKVCLHATNPICRYSNIHRSITLIQTWLS